ncbi:protease complex subunit PrcB family protein [Paraglaciecola sp. 2405UD69-4]|uniref:protease complex subunit PrcB family protein n=1 Tax=Paraglaciecola sp. 2405UD69-4 TaxID=3391836 RepID=UPI0039C9303C
MKKLFLLFPLLVPLQSCSDADATSPVPEMEFQVLHDFQYNEYANTTAKSTILINSQSEYESELLKRSSDTPQNIDFDSETVLLVDMGTQSSGGYSLSVTLTEHNDHILASIDYQFPGANCGVTTALTNPTQIIKIETTKYVLVSEDISYSDC